MNDMDDLRASTQGSDDSFGFDDNFDNEIAFDGETAAAAERRGFTSNEWLIVSILVFLNVLALVVLLYMLLIGF